MPKHKPGDLVWKIPCAGFSAAPGWAQIQEQDGPDGPPPCLFCEDEAGCVEWATLWALPGQTREEALKALRNKKFIGMYCHVSECELAETPEHIDEQLVS